MKLTVESFWPRWEQPFRKLWEVPEEGCVIETMLYPDSRRFKVKIIQGNGAEHSYIWAQCTLDQNDQPRPETVKAKRTIQSGASSPQNAEKIDIDAGIAIILKYLKE